jgi:hypothetical protein
MAAPSFKRSPVAPVAPDFSEPAKSTKLITENFSCGRPSSWMIYLNSIVITVCALDEVAFIKVLPMVLFLWPSSIFASIAS